MGRILQTFGFVAQGAVPALRGMLRQWDWPLIKARGRYMFTRQVDPLVTRSGIPIQNASRLIAYWSMAYEPGFLDGWKDLIQTDTPVILDIGANYGMFGSLMRASFPRATIIGFEPFPDAAAFIRGLGAYNEVHQTALGNSEGKITLHYRDNDGYTGTTSEVFAGKTGDYPQSVEVGMKRLDEFKLTADLIKCDVDGSEDDVVRGGIETFRRAKAAIIECDQRGSHLPLLAELLQKRPRHLRVDDYLFAGSLQGAS